MRSLSNILFVLLTFVGVHRIAMFVCSFVGLLDFQGFSFHFLNVHVFCHCEIIVSALERQ